ncbi:MAG: sensor histidine kinase [Anaerolineae bacterium]|nr:sensor histidine kinase [Anaerolineae bacterium]
MTEILLNTLEDERRYVARELHDGVAQTTLQLGLQAGICRKLLERGNLEMLATELAELEGRIQLASHQVREVIADMRRPQLEPEANLNEYIQRAIDHHLERGGPPVECNCNITNFPPYSNQQKLALFRVVQEALLNIRKHANAQNVRITISNNDKDFCLTISDDGQGFDLKEVAARPIDKGGAGLANLRVRAQAVGGSLAIERNAGGRWTEITIILPKTGH